MRDVQLSRRLYVFPTLLQMSIFSILPAYWDALKKPVRVKMLVTQTVQEVKEKGRLCLKPMPSLTPTACSWWRQDTKDPFHASDHLAPNFDDAISLWHGTSPIVPVSFWLHRGAERQTLLHDRRWPTAGKHS